MRSLYETCQPREEVLHGELREELFAARLKDVLDGTADPVYQHPARFFEHTYPTEGLRTLLREALGRLTGRDPTANAVVRLETPFGGGKTHNLIALYHAARGCHEAAALVPADVIPPPGAVHIVGIVGSELDPTGGLLHPDVTTYTLWGELAYQLGGAAGYRLVAESDRHTKAAPGAAVLDQLIGDHPTLILIDELARYLRAASAVPTATQRGDLSEQTIAFLMSLLEFAASRERVVVVLTLADPSDAFGKETEELRERLAEAQRVIARSERVITPADEKEAAPIVAHRLFRHIDREAAYETAQVYYDFYRHLAEQGVPLPRDLPTAQYADHIMTTYPFHPALLNVLSIRIATIPNFQRTRGALRLLALVVRRLWECRPQPLPLIHPHHVDLSLPAIVEELTSRLDRPSFKQVIEADIASSVPGHPAHAQQIDAEQGISGRPGYAQRLATAVLLNSLVQGRAAGLEHAELLAAVLEPWDDPAILDRALTKLVERCWFLDDSNQRYCFSTEVQLPKVIADEAAIVPVTQAKAKLEERIQQIWQRGALQPVFFPSEPSEVPDDAGPPKLVVLHFDAASHTGTENTPPRLVSELFEYAGSIGSFRRYRNNLVFLVADRNQRDALVEHARRYLAIDRIVGDPARLQGFRQEQQQRLRALREQSELELRIAITRAYRFLYYPSGDALADSTLPLMRTVLPAQDQGAVRRNQTEVVADLLKTIEKLRSGDAAPLSAAFVRERAWEGQQGAVSTEAIRRAFAQRVNLPMLGDPNLLKRTIRDGIRTKQWVYYVPADNKAYDADSPEPQIEISDEVFLYTPEEAARQRLPLARTAAPEPEKRCPVCRNPITQCTCGVGIGEEPEQRTKSTILLLKASGTPAQAFQDVVDQCAERRIERLSQLQLTFDAEGMLAVQEMRGLGVALSQLNGPRLAVSIRVVAKVGNDGYLHVEFVGEETYARPVRQLIEGVGGQTQELHVTAEVTVDFGPDGIAVDKELGGIMESFATLLSSGKVDLVATPVQVTEQGDA